MTIFMYIISFYNYVYLLCTPISLVDVYNFVVCSNFKLICVCFVATLFYIKYFLSIHAFILIFDVTIINDFDKAVESLYFNCFTEVGNRKTNGHHIYFEGELLFYGFVSF